MRDKEYYRVVPGFCSDGYAVIRGYGITGWVVATYTTKTVAFEVAYFLNMRADDEQ